MQIERAAFWTPAEVKSAVDKLIERMESHGESIDYLTFVPDGEPTLDANLGEHIRALGSIGKQIAVITNASLLWRSDVRTELTDAHWVSVKVDSVNEETWRKLDRPHGQLSLDCVLEGLVEFAAEFRGKLVTETMLVRDLNDTSEELEDVAAFVSRLRPAAAYISAPTRPPAEPWVKLPTLSARVRAHEAFALHVDHAELVMEYEGNEFAVSGDLERSLLDTASVHPLREEAVRRLLEKAGADWSVVSNLVSNGLLAELLYAGHVYYVRKLPGVRRGDKTFGEDRSWGRHR